MTWGSTSWTRVLGWLALVATAASCGAGAEAESSGRTVERAALATTSTSATPTSSSTVPASPTAVPPADPAGSSTTTRPHPPRHVTEQAWVPYALVGSLTLHHPSNLVEAIGFHQSGHDGAQHQAAAGGAARWFVQEDRDRDTDPQGAADIVVAPDHEVRAPVTGTVLRAGTYTLYCDKVDQFVVIEPDARPGWEVKVLHLEGLVLVKGQRVEAGVTRLAAKARVLPFASTVEDDTAVPAWPHVHLEVVDPSIPDRPSGPGCP